MSFLVPLLVTVQIVAALAMIGLVLIQHGKGADMGAAFGSGASGSLFGATGGANFLSRTTAVLASVFFVVTLALAYFSNARPVHSGSVLEGPAAVTPVAPVAPETAAQIPGAASVPATTTQPDVAPAPAAAGNAAQIPAK